MTTLFISSSKHYTTPYERKAELAFEECSKINSVGPIAFKARIIFNGMWPLRRGGYDYGTSMSLL